MNKRNSLSGILLSLSVLASTRALSQAPTLDGESIVLAIATKSDTIKTGANLIVDITMANLHKEPYCYVEIIETGKADMNGYRLEVNDAGSKTLPVTKPKWPRGWSEGSQCVDHGKTVSDELLVNRLVDISKPGAYGIRVSRRDQLTNQIVWSNRIAVVITP